MSLTAKYHWLARHSQTSIFDWLDGFVSIHKFDILIRLVCLISLFIVLYQGVVIKISLLYGLMMGLNWFTFG